MADISAKDVAALRKLTGAGMMDCKQALAESDGDSERAKTWLREKGKAGAAKREGRAADQGAIDVVVDGSVAALVELNCETDFVAKGDVFKTAVGSLAKLAAVSSDVGDLAGQPFEGATVGEYLTQLGATLGEKIELGRVTRYESDGLLDAYKHIQNERGIIGVLVELAGVDSSDVKAREVAHDIALHIASAAPRVVTRDEVPADDIERERAVFEAQTKEEGKPEQAWPKIVEGKLNGYFKTVALVEQGFVKDPKQTIAALLATLGAGASVKRFSRVKIGED